MLSLLKKSGDKSSALQPAWHPNFRDVEHLPDTKAVRTAFFINGLAVLAAVTLTIYFVYTEYSLGALRTNIAQWEETIAANKSASDAAIANFKKFQAEEAKFKAVETILKPRLVFSDLVFYMGNTLPPDIRLGSLDYRSSGVNLTATVRGIPEVASGMVTTYLEQLRNDPVLKGMFGEVELLNMSRNTSAELISIEVMLRYPVPVKPKGKK